MKRAAILLALLWPAASSAQTCGEAACQPVSSQPFYSYYVGASCNGKEYGRLDASTDGRAPSWDAAGLAGTTNTTATMLSYRITAAMGGTCTNFPATMVSGAERIYRCPMGNQVLCNGTCIVDDGLQCCPSPSDGVTCTLPCGAGYKRCTPGGACIAAAGCCVAADCAAPPNGCYVSPGTCAAGTCTYAYANGKACDADGDKCTPNDACNNGACVADTAHTVVCAKLDCKSGSCNKSSGNCDYVDVAGACGGTGCYSAGTCSAGMCSGTPKDCSGGVPQCKVGICDADSGNCATNNAMNGTPCTTTDLCQEGPMCSGGLCVGTPKACTPSGPCVASSCDASSGACVETQLPAGTPCDALDGCSLGTGTCDAAGQCAAEPVADGTPCMAPGCSAPGLCTSGACSCGDAPDGGIGGIPDADGSDAGCGCTLGARPASARLALSLALAIVVLAMRRRRG